MSSQYGGYWIFTVSQLLHGFCFMAGVHKFPSQEADEHFLSYDEVKYLEEELHVVKFVPDETNEIKKIKETPISDSENLAPESLDKHGSNVPVHHIDQIVEEKNPVKEETYLTIPTEKESDKKTDSQKKRNYQKKKN